MNSDADFFMARANAMLARSPEQRAAAEMKAAAYEAEKADKERREREQYRQRRDSELSMWREQRRRRLEESRARAQREGMVEIIPDPGPPPDIDWFNNFLLHRVPGLLFSQCRHIGRMALSMGAERCPAGHRNPPAYTLNFAKRMMKGEISQFVSQQSVIGREHLLKLGSQSPRFTENDIEAGELPPHLRNNMHEFAQAAREHRPGPLLPIGDSFVPRGTMPSREPGED